jgi:hypothetical protein
MYKVYLLQYKSQFHYVFNVNPGNQGCFLKKMQQSFSATETRYESWNMKINYHKTEVTHLSHIFRFPEAHLSSNGQNIPFVNHMKYFRVIFDKRFTWRLQIEVIDAKAFRTFTRMVSLFRIERLSANIKLTLHKALVR